jgi:thioredoxin 1
LQAENRRKNAVAQIRIEPDKTTERMKKYILLSIIIIPFMLSECKAENPVIPETVTEPVKSVIQLTTETFKKLIFNYETNSEWKFAGNKPAIIDFYADWCGPCKQLSPLVEEIAKEYSGKIDFYKVDTDKERILTQKLGITGLPTLVFIPEKGKPQIAVGALPKETLIKVINEVLLVK